jgi:hypothetical protein
LIHCRDFSGALTLSLRRSNADESTALRLFGHRAYHFLLGLIARGAGWAANDWHQFPAALLSIFVKFDFQGGYRSSPDKVMLLTLTD